MPEPTVAVASSRQLAADAGARIADEGGNAVDAAIAAVLVSVTTEPGVCSLGGGGFVTVWPPGSEPVTFDGNVAYPGLGLAPELRGRGVRSAHVEYGGGVDMIVGHGSAATPGCVAALEKSWRAFGKLPWAALFEPAIEFARDGFPLSQASYDYLKHAHESVFGWDPASHAALHHDSGKLKGMGEPVHVANLEDSMRAVAELGAREFYEGDLGRRIAEGIQREEGAVTREDLMRYECIERPALDLAFDDWRIATNPPPAMGGVALAAMLLLMRDRTLDAWTEEDVARLVKVQHAVIAHRHAQLDFSTRIAEDAHALLKLAAQGTMPPMSSSSTVHTSAVDASGCACSITMSAGYGSGAIPHGTGIWLNNCLGEIELNRRGLTGGTPGERLPSNMAPTVAREGKSRVLAIGSPGAERITSAILMTLLNYLKLGLPLDEAVRHPRVHLEYRELQTRVFHEPGLPVGGITLPLRPFDSLSMYFGGVGAATYSADEGFAVAADPRRTGGTALGGRSA